MILKINNYLIKTQYILKTLKKNNGFIFMIVEAFYSFLCSYVCYPGVLNI